MSQYQFLDKVWDEIKRCYRCGYCREMVRDLTGTNRPCPVREQLRFEHYTARGRNTIARGLVEGNLQLSTGLRDLVYTCLGCGGCKDACSLIDWAKIDTPAVTRAMREELHQRGLTPRAVLDVLKTKSMARPAMATCEQACPLGQNIPEYVRCISEGDIPSALRIIRADNPLPSVCGRACTRFCESACRQGEIGQPVNIMGLKRFCLDWEQAQGDNTFGGRPGKYDHGTVAIVGSGPAGLTAADYLVQRGIGVTIIERDSRLGGMLTLAIPEFTLPADIVDRDIACITGSGVQVRMGATLGSDYTAEDILAEGFKAVLVCCGAWQPRRMALPNSDLAGITDGLTFLSRLKVGDMPEGMDRVLVIGGGETALDVARSARRLGAQAEIIYRRSRQEMPVSAESLELTLSEGVILHESLLPVSILGQNGRVSGIKAMPVRFMDRDANGRYYPVFADGPEREFSASLLVRAVGQQPEALTWKGSLDIRLKTNSCLETDDEMRVCDLPVFAAGDIVTGPSSIVEAMASGKRAAQGITRFLGVTEAVPPLTARTEPQPVKTKARGDALMGARTPVPRRYIGDPPSDFEEVVLGYSLAEAVREAGRCLRCNSNYTDCQCQPEAEVLFFSGCNNRYRYPQTTQAALEILKKGGITAYTSPEEGCCGSPAYWGGDVQLAERLRQGNLDMFKRMGVRKIITACADCHAVFAREYDLAAHGIELEHFVTTLDGLITAGKVHLKNYTGTITYHDPCQLAREANIIASPRHILSSIKQLEFVEMSCMGKGTQCCGGGPNMLVRLSHPQLGETIGRNRLVQAREVGARALVTACSWCRTQLGTLEDENCPVYDFPDFIYRVVGVENH